MSGPFYVGYHNRAPGPLTRFLRARVGVTLATAFTLALLLAGIQRPPAAASFEYGIRRQLTGVILEGPVPLLVTGDSTGPSAVLILVGQFKHGAADLVRGLDGQHALVTGTLIFRGPWTMLELAERPPPVSTAGAGLSSGWQDHGILTVEGELVDAKCHLGAMNPGAGETHRLCAIRCLRGGIPAAVAIEGTGAGPREGLVLLEPGPGMDLAAMGGRRVRVAGRSGQLDALTLVAARQVEVVP